MKFRVIVVLSGFLFLLLMGSWQIKTDSLKSEVFPTTIIYHSFHGCGGILESAKIKIEQTGDVVIAKRYNCSVELDSIGLETINQFYKNIEQLKKIGEDCSGWSDWTNTIVVQLEGQSEISYFGSSCEWPIEEFRTFETSLFEKCAD